VRIRRRQASRRRIKSQSRPKFDSGKSFGDSGMRMDAFEVSSWEEFEQGVERLRAAHQKAMGGVLFRGQANSAWPLQTTLERRMGPKYQVQDYYFLIHRIKSQIETFTTHDGRRSQSLTKSERWPLELFAKLMPQTKGNFRASRRAPLPANPRRSLLLGHSNNYWGAPCAHFL
jgi:hypothetical protein